MLKMTLEMSVLKRMTLEMCVEEDNPRDGSVEEDDPRDVCLDEDDPQDVCLDEFHRGGCVEDEPRDVCTSSCPISLPSSCSSYGEISDHLVSNWSNCHLFTSSHLQVHVLQV